MDDQLPEAQAPARIPAPQAELDSKPIAGLDATNHISTAKPAPAELAPVQPHDDRRIDQVIEAWTDGHLRNSPLAQATQAWNHLLSSLPALKAMLLKGD